MTLFACRSNIFLLAFVKMNLLLANIEYIKVKRQLFVSWKYSTGCNSVVREKMYHVFKNTFRFKRKNTVN